MILERFLKQIFVRFERSDPKTDEVVGLPTAITIKSSKKQITKTSRYSGNRNTDLWQNMK